MEQEPCEDCISRQAVLEQLDVYCKNNCKYTEAEQEVMCRACDIGSCIELIEDMPSVTPQPKADTLDKIRAEIDLYLFQNEFGSEYRKEVSQIIDKYKAGEEE